jgi:lysophospholipase L1-like esterase
LSVRIPAAFVAALALALAAGPSIASAKQHAPHKTKKAKKKKKAKRQTPRYYLALGDSLSQGMQPDQNGTTLNTDEGYVDDIFGVEQHHIKNLQLVKLGCGGETTGSMITGQGNQFAGPLDCKPKGGSQLKAAELFLKAHHKKGQVPLITIDIGANDVDSCATASDLIGCVTTGENNIKTNLPVILSRLKAAAPAGTKFAGMTLYNPVLAGWFSSSSDTHNLALASTVFAKQINDDLTEADTNAGFVTADVAGAFDSYDSTDTVPFNGQSIPINVARVCSWTWACTTPPSGPNIHANKNGYAVIAQAFETAIGTLH